MLQVRQMLELQKLKLHSRGKLQILQSLAAPNRLPSVNHAQLSPLERLHLGNPESVKCNLNRIAAKGRPLDPTFLSDLVISFPFNENVDGDSFLIDDNLDYTDRIIVLVVIFA